MFYKYFALFAALATTLAAAPMASPEPQTEISNPMGTLSIAADGTSTYRPKPGAHEVTGPFGTLNVAPDGASTFVPWYAPLIPGSEARAKPWGYRPGKSGGRPQNEAAPAPAPPAAAAAPPAAQ